MADPVPPRRVLAVVPDLFFASRIAATAKLADVGVAFVPLAGTHAACAAAPPDLLIVDLHAGPEVPVLLRALKADAATAAVPLVGFHSHVDIETRKAALAAGLDRALPRSAFVARLADLLAGREA
ncbi:MAG: hypothetical protein IT347_14175 [Candidatus Eisenbacteria bacterium]|nr:hypothetical protein [Candidatus Eisenbacteria bacterium]